MARPKKQVKTVKVQSGGLGTDIANVLENTGVKKLVELFVDGKDCGCDKREKALNQILPRTVTARCFTEDEYNTYKAYREIRTVVMSWEQIKYICELYHSIFQLKGNVYYHCVSCSPKPMIKRIDLLDKVFESYDKDLA